MFKFKTRLLSIFLLISIIFNSISVSADSSKDISVKNYKERQFCGSILETICMHRRTKQEMDLILDMIYRNKFGLILTSCMPLKIIMEEKTLKVTGWFYPDIDLKPVKVVSSYGGDITKKLLDNNNILELDDGLQSIDVRFEHQPELPELKHLFESGEFESFKGLRGNFLLLGFPPTTLSLSTNIPFTVLFSKGSILEIPLIDKFQLKKVIAKETDVTTKIVNEHEFEFESIGDNIFMLEMLEIEPAKDK